MDSRRIGGGGQHSISAPYYHYQCSACMYVTNTNAGVKLLGC